MWEIEQSNINSHFGDGYKIQFYWLFNLGNQKVPKHLWISHEVDQSLPGAGQTWAISNAIMVRTNFMKQCLLSRTPRSQFNTTEVSNQVTIVFQIRVTPVNFSWGRPTVAWGWTDLGHQGSMSVFTRNKCYRILVLPRITFSRAYHQSQILTQPTFLGS